MKRYLICILFLLQRLVLWCQVPVVFLHQAVVRDAQGVLVCDRTIGVRLSILQGSESGEPVYSESFVTRTNAYGLYTIEVGSSSNLMAVDWTLQPFYVRSEVDVDGGNSYSVEATHELYSVPFAMSVQVARSIPGIVQYETDPVFSAWGKDYNDITNSPVNISSWVNDVGYITDYTETQVLSIGHDTIYLTGGSFVKLPAGFDGDYNHLSNMPSMSSFVNDVGYFADFQETQALSIRADTIFLTGGSFVVLPMVAESQGLSSVVGFGNSADSSQLKALQDPTDPQDVVTRQYLDSLTYSISHSDRGTHNISVADECEKVFWNGLYYTQSGVYTYDYSNSEGFFSTDTLFLTIRHGNHHTYHQTVDSTYTWHGHTYNNTGTYYYSYTSNSGCPSLDTLHLTVINESSMSCTRYRYEIDTAILYSCGDCSWHGRRIWNSGIYEHRVPVRYGQSCDSVVRVRIHVYNTFRYDTAIRSSVPITWRGQSYSQQGNYADTLKDANNCDSIYALHLIMHGEGGVGCAPGFYSVAPGLQVAFAQGNLLFQSANDRWMFAPQQYDVLNDMCLERYYHPYTDKFSWATSGYHNNQDSLNVNYLPWIHNSQAAPVGSVSYSYNRYGYGPSSFMPDSNLVDSSANYDWGQYNPIVNGGKGSMEWFTLSMKQWDYVFYHRPNADQLSSVAQIVVPNPTQQSGNIIVPGYIILADNWVRPSGINFTPHASNPAMNQYTLSQWNTLENSGAVFLPGSLYWTSTSFNGGNAYCLNTAFQDPMVAPYNKSNQYYVRLAQYATIGMSQCNCSYYDTVIVSPGSFTWHGRTLTRSGDYLDTLVNAAGCDSLVFYSLVINDNGRLDSLFSVSANRKVYFSKGNLQYHPQRQLWRFAPLQYDCFATLNRYVEKKDLNRCWIDIFAWATSGYHDSTDNLNTAYYPYSTSGSFGPSSNMSEQSLVNESRSYDWGQHCPIVNGGNVAGLWRTLTSDEWNYLYNLRPRAMQLRRWVDVMGVKGLLLLPDNWSSPVGFSFNTEDEYGGTDWNLLESSGAVFLPAGGYYSSSSAYYIGEACCYWSTTAVPYSTNAHGFYYSPNINTYQNGSGAYSYSRSGRRSVRLVQDY
ncbi:MAG: hypothetical protein MJZ51_06350 [Bacteroidales bacterium]|nr:hypothetical protein [Bacteroidales bacterium]